MFDKTAIEEYKQVAAPANLKERVMKTYQTGNAKKSNIRMYKTFSLVAACLVLVFAASFFVSRDGNRISVSIYGSQVSEQPMTISMAVPMNAAVDDATANDATANDATANEGIMMASFGRTIQPQMNIPLTVEVSSESKIAVSGGEMQIFDAATGELLFTGMEYTAKGTVSVEWWVEASEPEAALDNTSSMGDTPYMCISAGKKVCTLQLEYDETDGVWMIYQK